MSSAAFRVAVLLVLAATTPTLAVPAAAQEPAPDAPSAAVSGENGEPRFELALLGGRRFGGLLRVDTGGNVPLNVRDASAIGGRLGWRVGSRVTLQAELAHQETELIRRRPESAGETVADIAIDYLQAGPRIRLNGGVVRLYLAGGLGVMRFRSRDGGDTDLYPTLSGGPGALVLLSRNLALTGDLRFFGTLLGADTTIPCQRPEADCLRTGNDTVLVQIQLLGGLTLRF